MILTHHEPISKKEIYLSQMKDASTQEIDMILESLVRIDKAVRIVKKVGTTEVMCYASPEVAAKIKRDSAQRPA
jgi:hypothetical protein